MEVTNFDRTETIGRSLVQHGPRNHRAYLMKLHPDDRQDIVERLDAVARRNGYSKIFVKVPRALASAFERAGYREEARIPGLYRAQDDGSFLARYLDPSREHDEDHDRVRNILSLARRKARAAPETLSPSPYRVEDARPDDLEAMAAVYREVFASYPFPIHDAAYLQRTMAGNVRYFCARRDEGIAALASADMDVEGQNAEMTDFATLSAHLGQGLALRLLWHIERAVRQDNVTTAYTIARSLSAGMNVTFSKMGYQFAGTLHNNTDIAGNIESMNVWFKRLR